MIGKSPPLRGELNAFALYRKRVSLSKGPLGLDSYTIPPLILVFHPTGVLSLGRMALKANYGKRELLKTIKTIVPKGAKLREALSMAAKFGVRKGATGKLGQSKTKELMHELKEKHDIKSSIKGVSTYGSTVKGIIEAATESKEEAVDPRAALEDKLAEKEKINAALKAKTAAENPQGEKPRLTETQKRENIRAGQESAAAAEAGGSERGGVPAVAASPVGERHDKIELAEPIRLPDPPKPSEAIDMDIG